MNDSSSRANRIFLFFFVLISILLIGTAGISYGYTLHLLDKIPYRNSPVIPSMSQVMTESSTLSDLSEAEVNTQTCQSINILLVGQDRQPGEAYSRSDSMILCTFRKQEDTLILTSLLRDLYVPIPGYRDNRINAAYAAGGLPLLQKTIETNFQIPITGTVEVDFSQFASIIDLLGGVTMELRQDEADAINSTCAGRVHSGIQLLTGQQALAYARIRKLDSDGDFSRTRRQRNLLSALLNRYRSASFSELITTLETVLPMVTTDLSKRQILDLILEIGSSLSRIQIHTQHVPAEGTYRYQKIRGMSVLVADMDAARSLLKNTCTAETN